MENGGVVGFWILLNKILKNINVTTIKVVLTLVALISFCVIFSYTNRVRTAVYNVSFNQIVGNAENYKLKLSLVSNVSARNYDENKSQYQLDEINPDNVVELSEQDKIKIANFKKTNPESVISEDNVAGIFDFIYEENLFIYKSFINKTDTTLTHNTNDIFKKNYPKNIYKEGNVVFRGIGHIVAFSNNVGNIVGKFSTLPTYVRNSVLAPYDVTQGSLVYHIDTDVRLDTLRIDMCRPTEFSQMIPQPDCIAMDAIIFADSAKLRIIQREGLKFHVKLPTMQNLQNMRSYLITTFISLFFTLLMTLLYKKFKEYIIRKTQQVEEKKE